MTRDREHSRRGEDFASRWSRLKRETRKPGAETARPPGTRPDPSPETPAETPAAAPESEARSDAEILEEFGLPDPDTLGRGDDFKAFMASGVPARIRNRALRRLWSSNPVLANLDRLVDYDDDFTDAAMVPAILNTGYKVGRGWMEDDEKDDEKDAGADDEAAADAEAAAGADAPGADASPAEVSRAAERDAAPAGREDPAAGDGGRESPAGSGPSGEAGEAQPWPAARTRAHAPPRRMRFRFAQE